MRARRLGLPCLRVYDAVATALQVRRAVALQPLDDEQAADHVVLLEPLAYVVDDAQPFAGRSGISSPSD